MKEKNEEKEWISFSFSNHWLVIKTLRCYFWQAFLQNEVNCRGQINNFTFFFFEWLNNKKGNFWILKYVKSDGLGRRSVSAIDPFVCDLVPFMIVWSKKL